MKTSEITDRLQEWQKRAGETARNVAGATDQYVRDNTWTSIAFAAVIGCVVGFFLGRRGD